MTIKEAPTRLYCLINPQNKTFFCKLLESNFLPLATATPRVWSRHQYIHGLGSKFMHIPQTLPQTHSTGQNSQSASKPLNLLILASKWPTPLPAILHRTQVNLLPTKLEIHFSTHLSAAQLHPPDCSLYLATDSLHATQKIANCASGRGLPAILMFNSVKLCVVMICQHATTRQASGLPTCLINTANNSSKLVQTKLDTH